MNPTEEESLRRDWLRFTLVTFFFGFGFAVYGGVFQNFMRDALGAHELDLGRLESLREIPGFCSALMAGTLIALAESRIAAVGLGICAIGIAISGWMKALPPLMAITVFWSIGFHLWATMQNAITLALAKGREGGRHLGRMSGVSAIATIGGLGVATLGARFLPRGYFLPYFIVAGAAILVSAFYCGSLSHRAAGGVRQRIVIRKEYGLYYLLYFLEGCRRQIFSIFATFALILVYHQKVESMLVLQFVNAILITITAPWMGRLVDRIGERTPLTWYAIGLIVVFFGYAVTRRVETLYALYLIDNVLFSFGVGFTTYLHRIVRPGEFTPSMAMGVTVSHVAAVTVPFFGALLWKTSGNYQLPFWVGVGFAALSLVGTRWLPRGPARAAAEC